MEHCQQEESPERTRRGSRKKTNKTHSFNQLKIYFNNINGYTSKQNSLFQITKSISPDIIALCETKVSATASPKIRGYETIVSNCKQGKEGFLLAIKEGTFISAEKISESNEKNILTSKVIYPQCSMRFIIAHGPQETEDNEIKNEFYESLMVEIEKGKASDDNLVILGDMNAKIQRSVSDIDGIESTSANGKSLKEVVEKYELEVLNFHPNTVGEWTRIQKKKNIVEKSVIDYVLVEENLKNRVDGVIIDEDKLYTPWRSVFNKRGRRIIFSDHTAIITTINIKRGQLSNELSEQVKGWRITEEGLAKYKEITCGKDLVVVGEEGDTTKMYQSWLDQTEGIVNQCFIKKKPARKSAPTVSSGGAAFIRKTLAEFSSKGKIQREMVKDYVQRLIEREVEKCSETKENF